jgi:ribose transport system permease protein
MKRSPVLWLRENRWSWSFLGALIVWAVTVVSAGGRGAGDTISAALAFSSFYVMAGIGEMLVVSLGQGNIDLSIPSVMTLAGYLSIGVMRGQAGSLLLGLAVTIGVGVAAGAANLILIRLARIPPMVATLAAGFVMQSMTIAYSKGSTAKPPALLMDFALGRTFGVPWIAIVFILAAAMMALALDRTTFGRSLLAVGQSERAAYFAGVSIPRVTVIAYLACAVLAAFAGLLLAAYSGGAALDMASDFLLMSIAVVVLGGTSIAGGRASPVGIWSAALFLYLMSNMLNVLALGAGVRYALTGIIIIGILALSGDRSSA